MSPIGEVKQNNGFTLIEMLLVVLIVGIVLALSAPNFSKGYSRFQLKNTADDLLSMSRWAQAMAIGQERSYALSFSFDRHSYDLESATVNEESGEENGFEPVKGNLGRMHKIPDTIHLDTDKDRIRFYPDGTIDEATIQLNSPEQKEVLSSTQVRGMMTKVDDE